ncbi:MAG: DUF1501 domain-containing protein [Verrucomicrobiota bacterium JB025]|nr:DUF1501 domain-containing protein [Verrucomicrobiota bacterium JB025]
MHNDPKGLTRREWMRRGLQSGAGMMLAGQTAGGAASARPQREPTAKSVIQIFLWGGMSHTDTWDPKPDAGRDYTGDFDQVIDTNVDGIHLSSLFPQLAKQAHNYSLIRSMTHGINGHETAAYLMQTGHQPGERLAYPSLGAVFALFREKHYKGLIPPYVVLTKAAGRFSEEGFLGPLYKPFATGGNPNAATFEVEGIIARGISEDRQKARRNLLRRADTLAESMRDTKVIGEMLKARDTAYELILGSGKEVFDLTKEDPKLRDRYGRHTFGQECLAARRMVEAGVPFITINYPGGWDTHKNHFAQMRKQCPELDQGLAALLGDLKARGLLESTIVWCSGEFGRGPRVDWQPPWNGGRNHYGKVFSALVAGGGFKGGHVVGRSTERGEEVAERPVYPVDLLGSIYTLAGIDPHARLPHPMGAEAYVLPKPSDQVKSGGLLTEIMM